METLSSYSRRYLRNEKRRFIVHVFLLLLAFGFTIITPLLGSWVIDVLSNSGSVAMLIRPAIYTTLAGAISTVAAYVSSVNMTIMLSSCQYSAISDAITHIQKTSLGITDSSFDPAYLTQRITSDVNTVINFYCENCVQKFLYGGGIVAIGIILLSINPSFLLICILFSGLYVGVYLILKSPLAITVEHYKENTAIFHKALFNRLKRRIAVRMGVLFDEDESYTRKYFQRYQEKLLNYNKTAQLFSSLESAISVLFQTVILFVGGVRIINNDMTIGQYVILNTYFSFYIKSINYYVGYGKAHQDAHISYGRLRTLLDRTEEENGTFAPNVINQVSTSNLEFSFQPNGNDLFNQFSLKAKMPGLWVLKGENGSGKTTLINILTGMIRPSNRNCVEINDHSRDLDWYTLRKKNISVLLQHEDRTDMSVNEYFSFYHGKSLDSIAEEEMSPILKEWFFDTSFNLLRIRDRPIVSLSGGEWQRIRLFKALIKEADVFFLDEPANNLDKSSLIALRDLLIELKESKIVLITSHDSFLDAIADEIVWLEKGDRSR